MHYNIEGAHFVALRRQDAPNELYAANKLGVLLTPFGT